MSASSMRLTFFAVMLVSGLACAGSGSSGGDGSTNQDATGGTGAAGGAAGSGGTGGTSGNGADAAGGNAGSGGSPGDAAGPDWNPPAADRATVYISGGSIITRAYSLNLGTGMLTQTSMVDSGMGAGYLAFHPNKQFLYAINTDDQDVGSVRAFSINQTNGSLAAIDGPQPSGGMGAVHLAVHPSGNHLLVANYNSGHISVVPIGQDGTLGTPTQTLLPGAQAHQIITDASGDHVFVPCKGANFVAQYTFNVQNGTLTPNTPPTVATAAGAGPRHMDFHPNGRWAYLINETDDTMTAFDYDAQTGLLSNPATVTTLPQGADAASNSTAHVVVHPNGHWVYGSNRGYDSIATYAIDQTTGRLTVKDFDGGKGMVVIPRDFDVDPTGRYLIAANNNSVFAWVFAIDQTTGLLTMVQRVMTSQQPAFVGVLTWP